MEQNISVTKLNISGKLMYVRTKWNPNANDFFHIKIYDGDESWIGHYSHVCAKTFRDRFEETETEEQYNNNVKKALTNDSKFSYSLTVLPEDDRCAKFSWKRKSIDTIQGNLVTIVHGSVPVHWDQYAESKEELIDVLINENRELQSTVELLNNQNSGLILDLESCRKDLEKFVNMKTHLETGLYEKFVQLLSTKKKRIQVLEDHISRQSKRRFSEIDDG